MKSKKNNKGFTLVELLVVIAIIGILAVVAVPALFKNIEKGKVADLEGDISAIRSAVLSYYADNSEYPIDNDGTNNTVIELKSDMSYIVENGSGEDGAFVENEVSSSQKQGTLKLISELEGLSFPYGGSYKLTANDGTSVAESPETLYLTITTEDKNTTISDSGLDKLAQDLGLSNPTPASATASTTAIGVTPAGATGQIIIIPLIKN